MKKFCTNCGHANEQSNLVCVECGTKMADEKQQAKRSAAPVKPAKNKKPMSLKKKILWAASVLLIGSLIGVYSWGTNTASADTAVSKFFEALQSKDAERLADQVKLSNGKNMTVKEAAAFIEEYQSISPYELEDVASVEKNGKVIGIFDAHRVVIPVQKLSFYFPHEGLTLSLNGELVEDAEHSGDEYVFSGITPGFHEAEFLYDGEFAEFNYPFELTVGLYKASSDTEEIYEDLPLSSASFELETMAADNPDANKVVIGDKKIPVDEEGQTAEIGPLLLDGSTTVQAEVEFPWGIQLSDPVEITSNYHMLSFSGLEEEQQTALIDQLKIFAEEYVEAFAKRDSKVFTTLTKDQLALFADDIKWMKEGGNYFTGSLLEVGVDEESTTILEDGKTVTIGAEFVINGDYYNEYYEPGSDEYTDIVALDFVYDQDSKKWLLDGYDKNDWFSDMTPSVTFEGSGKVFKSDGAPEEATEDEEEVIGFTEKDAETFMNEYNNASVEAINAGDFSLVSGLISDAGPRWSEQESYIQDKYKQGLTQEHVSTSVESVKHLGEDLYEVVTIETFIITLDGSSSEKKYRTVTEITVDESGALVYELTATDPI